MFFSKSSIASLLVCVAVTFLAISSRPADAAATTMLVQTVVEARLFCFGSEVPIIVYDSDRDVVEVIVGLGAAPQLATRQWFVENRDGVIQGRGDIANCVVPGFLDAVLTLLDRYGTRSFAECSKPMLAELKRRSEMSVEAVGKRPRAPSNPAGWIEHHKNFHRLISRLVKAEKAAGADRRSGLQAVHDYFYRGPIAKEIDAWSRKNGGLLRYVDFANHHTRIDQPRSIEFRGHTIHKCDVWTQGPFLLQTLNLLADRDLEKMNHDSADYIHLVTEAMKLGFADRDAFYGDPTFVDVPIEELLSQDYTKLRRGLIKMDLASQEQQPGDPVNMKPLLGVAPEDYKVVSGFSEDTSNCLVADQWGNVIAATPSGWGGVPAGDTGVQLGSRLIGLVTWENHPSMVQPGDRQDQASIQILLNRLVFGIDPAAAVQLPRFNTGHHIDWFGHMKAKPGTLTVTKNTSKAVINDLKTRGHQVGIGRSAGASVVLAIDPETGQKHAAARSAKVALLSRSERRLCPALLINQGLFFLLKVID